VIEHENLCQRADLIGTQVADHLRSMQADGLQEHLGDIRQLGAMIAVDLVKDGDAGQPDAELTTRMVQQAAANGLLLLPCGVRGNVVRFLPALTIDEATLQQGLDIFGATLRSLV
jgi:4-aminobutyrate aminotransferase/(S)-3-amino-2-methylpropionate transaminase